MTRFDMQKFSASFPGGRVPEKLVQIWEFEKSGAYEQYSGEFLLDDDQTLLDHETGSGIRFILHNERFQAFGTDATGGVFALWSGDSSLITDTQLEVCPVVYIDSEAVYSTILAHNLDDFIRLLTLNSDHLGGCAARGVDLEREEGNEETQLFRKWVKEKLCLEPLDSGYDLVRSAKITHQDNFFDWYKQWQGESPWTKYEEDPVDGK